jgi:hypothetical protein
MWHVDIKAESSSDGVRQRFARRRLSVNYEDSRLRLSGKMTHPLEEIRLIRVGGQPPDGEHLCLDRYFLPENGDHLRTVHDLPAGSPLGLEAYDNDACAGTPQIVLQVMLDPAAFLYHARNIMAARIIDSWIGLR